MSKKLFALLVILVLLTGLLASCNKTKEEATLPPESAGGTSGDVALKITGKVSNEMDWPEADVRAMDTIDVESTNSKGETSTYTGVPINTLLEMAGLQTDATKLTFVADDGYTAEVTLAEVQACADCIVSFRNQGGFSTVLPGFPSSLQVKGVVEIKVE